MPSEDQRTQQLHISPAIHHTELLAPFPTFYMVYSPYEYFTASPATESQSPVQGWASLNHSFYLYAQTLKRTVPGTATSETKHSTRHSPLPPPSAMAQPFAAPHCFPTPFSFLHLSSQKMTHTGACIANLCQTTTIRCSEFHGSFGSRPQDPARGPQIETLSFRQNEVRDVYAD